MIPSLVVKFTSLGNGAEGTCPAAALALYRRAAYGSGADDDLTPLQVLLFNAGECCTRALIETRLPSQLTSHLLLTQVAPPQVAGIPSLLFSMSERGAKGMQVYGPGLSSQLTAREAPSIAPGGGGNRGSLPTYMTAVDTFVKRRYPEVLTTTQQAKHGTGLVGLPVADAATASLSETLRADLELKYAWARTAARSVPSSTDKAPSAGLKQPQAESWSPQLASIYVEATRHVGYARPKPGVGAADDNEIDLDGDDEASSGPSSDSTAAAGSCLCYLVTIRGPMRRVDEETAPPPAATNTQKPSCGPAKRQKLTNSKAERADQSGADSDGSNSSTSSSSTSDSDSSTSSSSSGTSSTPTSTTDTSSSGSDDSDGDKKNNPSVPSSSSSALPSPSFELRSYCVLVVDVPLRCDEGTRALASALQTAGIVADISKQGAVTPVDAVVHLVPQDVWRASIYQSAVVKALSDCHAGVRHLAVCETPPAAAVHPATATEPATDPTQQQRYSHFPSLMRQTIDLSQAAPSLFMHPYHSETEATAALDTIEGDPASSGVIKLLPLHQFQLAPAFTDLGSKGQVFRERHDGSSSNDSSSSSHDNQGSKAEPTDSIDKSVQQTASSGGEPLADEDSSASEFAAGATAAPSLPPPAQDRPSMWILGTGAAAPSKRRSCSGILVSTGGRISHDEGEFILLDVGEGCLGRLEMIAASVPDQHTNSSTTPLACVMRRLRCVWVSHMHADHHSGLLGVMRTFARAVVMTTTTEAACRPLVISGPPALAHQVNVYATMVTAELFLDTVAKAGVSVPSLFQFREVAAFDAQAPLLMAAAAGASAGSSASSSAELRLRLRAFRTIRVDHSCRDAYGCVLTLEQEQASSPPSMVVLAYSGDTVPCQAVVDGVTDAAKQAVAMATMTTATTGHSPQNSLQSSSGLLATPMPMGMPPSMMPMPMPMPQGMMHPMMMMAGNGGFYQPPYPMAAPYGIPQHQQMYYYQQQQQQMMMMQMHMMQQQQQQQAMSMQAVHSMQHPQQQAIAEQAPVSAPPVSVRCACYLVHEATMDDDREEDARRKKHSTVGGALSVKKRIEEALRKLEASYDSNIKVCLAGTVLTHFSQRYPAFPSPKQQAGANNSSHADEGSVAGHKRKQPGMGDSSTKSDMAAAGADAAPSSSSVAVVDKPEGRERTLFAFDGMVVPLVVPPARDVGGSSDADKADGTDLTASEDVFTRAEEVWAAIASKLEKDE